MVNIQTVIANLENTIRGKEKYLSEIYDARELNKGTDPASYAVAEFLEINLKELNAILTDCMAVREAEQEPVYAFRRKGQKSFCTCDKERYKELSDKPNLFEVTTLYAAPVRTKDLTDDEIMDLVRDECVDMRWPSTPLFIARAVIAADREKNK